MKNFIKYSATSFCTNRKAFTLVEIIIAVAVFSIVVISAIAITYKTPNFLKVQTNKLSSRNDVNIIIRDITKTIEQSTFVTAKAGNPTPAFYQKTDKSEFIYYKIENNKLIKVISTNGSESSKSMTDSNFININNINSGNLFNVKLKVINKDSDKIDEYEFKVARRINSLSASPIILNEDEKLNNGTLKENEITITSNSGIFKKDISKESIYLNGLPEGLSYQSLSWIDQSNVKITIGGKAKYHSISDNTTFKISIGKTAFESIDSSTETGSIAIKFIDEYASITTSTNVLVESQANDGSLSENSIITVIAQGGIFTDQIKNAVNIDGLPEGFSYSVVNNSNPNKIDIKFSGKAAPDRHGSSNSTTFKIMIEKDGITNTYGAVESSPIMLQFRDAAAAITASPDKIVESALNDGSLEVGEIIITSQNCKFSSVNNSNIEIQLPAGLDKTITKISNTELSIKITGKAVNHASENSISCKITANADAFEGGTSPAETAIKIEFLDSISMTASPEVLYESDKNDGSLKDNEIYVSLSDNTFSNPTKHNLIVSGLSNGLSVSSVEKQTDSAAKITLTGKALSHNSSNNTSINVVAKIGAIQDVNRDMVSNEIDIEFTDDSEKDIIEFYFESPPAKGTIFNEGNSGRISVGVPSSTNLKSLKPIVVHTGKSINPASGISLDFTNQVNYEVTAKDNSKKVYTVTVTKLNNMPPEARNLRFIDKQYYYWRWEWNWDKGWFGWWEKVWGWHSQPPLIESRIKGIRMTLVYDYYDKENDREGNTEIIWCYAKSRKGKFTEMTEFRNKKHIEIKDSSFSIVKNKYIKVKVTPVALTGTSPGLPVESAINKEDCFIATAAYGTKYMPQVVLLRNFRDKCLMTNYFGRSFVDFYYNVSPPIADFIAGSELLKFIVRALLTPFVLLAYYFLNPVKTLIVLSTLIIIKLRYNQKCSKIIM